MKEKVRKFSKLAYWLILGMILMYIVGMQFYAQEITDFIGYRFYAVMTDSMEPRIPTYSMVLTKTIDENESIAPGEIITFKVQRGEQEIVLTHHFNKTQEENGQLYYRTNAEGRDELDLYYTKRSDIIGKYVWHIPLLGKFIMFIQSNFSWILYCEFLLIWLINKTIKAHWEEKGELDDEVKIPRKLDNA